MNPLSIKQIRARFNKELPKFIGLKNHNGDWEVTMNNPKTSAKQKMLAIEKFFAKESTEDGIYFFISKESLNTRTPERSTPVAKGNVKNLPAILEPAPRVTIQERATEDVWDMKTALEKSTEIIRLEFKVGELTRENVELRRQIAVLEAAEPEENDSTKTVSQFKELAEMFTPLVDKWFEHDAEKIKLKKQQLALAGTGKQLPATRRGAASDTREDGGIPVDHPRYESYFKMVVEEGTNEQLDNECNYLEEVDPDFYKELGAKYGVNEAEKEEETTPETEGETENK